MSTPDKPNPIASEDPPDEGSSGAFAPKPPPIAWPNSPADIATHAANNQPVDEKFVLPPGLLISSKYRIVSELGRGGMGAVYLVDHVQLHAQFALKTINPTKTNETSLARFQKEARAASLLDHPGLVKVHDFGLVGTQPYFVMDLVRGESLADRIKKTGPLSIEDALHMLIQVSLALGYAHEKGVIHRDLKPSNIMLPTHGTGEQQIKIVDFGIAKVLNDTGDSVTKTGEIFGSPLYMSPEQCLGQDVDQRSDIYSLGCVAFEALTGLPPFLSDSALFAMLKHQSEVPPTLKEATLGKEFPADVERVIARLLEKEPGRRYQNLYSLAGDLNKIKMGREVQLSQAQKETATVSKPQAPEKKAIRVETAVLMAVLTSASAFAAGAWLNSGQNAQHPDKNVAVRPLDTVDISKFDGGKKETVERPTRPFSDVLPSGKRIYHFPTKYAVGTITVRGGSLKSHFLVNGSFCTDIPARGTIEQLEFKPFNLRLGLGMVEHPEVLLGFRSDELCKLSLPEGQEIETPTRNFGANDTTLTYVDKLTSLVILQVTGTAVSDASIEVINKLPNLRALIANESKITDAGAASLANLNSLLQLELGHIQLAPANKPGSLCQKLKTCKRLVRIKLNHSGATDEHVRLLASNKSIEEIYLSHNPAITPASLEYLATMPKLKFLALDGDFNITPSCIETLAKLRNLTHLTLSKYGWNEQDRKTLSTKLKKCTILFGNLEPQISEEINQQAETIYRADKP